MSEQERAVEKLRDEMARLANHPGVAVLGEYMTERLRKEPGIAAAILRDKKTLEGAFGAIRDHARGHQKNGFAYVASDEAFRICDRYYGLHGAAAEEKAPDALDLDALLGM